MSAGYEPTIVFTWMRSTLLGDPTIQAEMVDRVYRSIADPSATLPNIVLQVQSLRDVIFVGGIRVIVDGLFAVRVTYAGNSATKLDQVMARVDAVLDGKKNQVVSGGIINSCVRQWIQELPFVDNGQLYRQQLGLYAIQAQGTP